MIWVGDRTHRVEQLQSFRLLGRKLAQRPREATSQVLVGEVNSDHAWVAEAGEDESGRQLVSDLVVVQLYLLDLVDVGDD